MLISRVRAFQPATPGSPPDWRTSLGQIIVEVETDSGLTGYGVGGGGAASIHIVETVLSEVLLGQPADAVERLHAEMVEHTSFYGRKGIVVMAISGIDLALWDVRGKSAGLQVAQLLAAEIDLQRQLPTYVTVFGAEETEAALHAGHAAVKLHVERFGDRPDPNEISRLVAEARRLLGPGRDLMIDAFARWDLESTLRVAEAVAPFNLTWLEEPLRPDDLRGYQQLAARSPVPIAGGEHEYLEAGFAQLIDEKLHAVLQPDVNWCGGLTTLLQIYHRADAAGIRVCPHRGCEPYALPAIAALDSQPLAESARSWFRCLEPPTQISNGRIQLHNGPGFGVTPQ